MAQELTTAGRSPLYPYRTASPRGQESRVTSENGNSVRNLFSIGVFEEWCLAIGACSWRRWSSCSLLIGLEQAGAVGLVDRRRGIVDVELLVDAFDVGVHGGVADVELCRDFLLNQTFRQ